MRISLLKIENFRGIAEGEISFSEHNVLIGDNNIGKSSVLEAIDLVLGPERLSKRPVIDEHDFYAGDYVDEDGDPVEIKIRLVVSDLTEEQQRHFKEHLQWWNKTSQKLIEEAPAEATDSEEVIPALAVEFVGSYDKEEDDFTGETFFSLPTSEAGTRSVFKNSDKRLCGFLFLRTLRTGFRALSLERGSLLDIILKLQDKRLQMWEDVLGELRKLPVAEKPELGITDILTSVQDSLRSFVPSEWADKPHMRVSDLTRENLRKTLTVFMGTGAKNKEGKEYSAPFQHQGTGTINILVLALLSIIADLKQNVIFAMEEPEIAIPPHTQKSIIESVRLKSAQAIFTSHSPYVLEEFDPTQIIVLKKKDGILTSSRAEFPPTIKPKAYKTQFRTRFCESLLSRRVLIVEGHTEYDVFPVAARRLHELHPTDFKSLDAMGLAVINAETDSQIAPLGTHFKNLGKITFAIFDKQDDVVQKAAIKAGVDFAFESPEAGCENLILKGVAEVALRRFVLALVSNGEWPPHLSGPGKTPDASTPIDQLRKIMLDYFAWSKGAGTAADLVGQCTKAEMPDFIVNTLSEIKKAVEAGSNNAAVI